MLDDEKLIVSDDCYEIRVESSAIGRVPLEVAGLGSSMWRPGETSQPIGDPRVLVSYYPDHTTLHAELVDSLLADAGQQSANMHGMGGKKVRDNAAWGLPAFRILTLRALLMFCKQYRVNAAHITDRWGNVLETSDYSAAHSHYESVASAVYFVDLGETSPNHPLSGNFEIMDPRIPFCCSQGAERPTRGLMPQAQAGVMLLFPSELLHSVHPYYGRRPRLTLAWNIKPGPRPAGQTRSLQEQLPGSYGVV